MKKVLAILALALFIGGFSAPVIAASSDVLTEISLNEDDPKKSDKKAESSEKKSDSSKSKKKSDCSKSEKKSECGDSKKSSDCSKKCGDKC